MFEMDFVTGLFGVLILANCVAYFGWVHEIGKREALERVVRMRTTHERVN